MLFFEGVDHLLEYIKRFGVLPNDQYMGGKFLEWLINCELLSEEHPDRIKAVIIIDCMVRHHNTCVAVNEISSLGGYIPDQGVRDKEPMHAERDTVKYSTAVAKTVLAALLPTITPDRVVIEIGGGNGNFLRHICHGSGLLLGRYLNVDNDAMRKLSLFEKVVAPFRQNVRRIDLMVQDFNDVFQSIMADPANMKATYLSLNSIYYLGAGALAALFTRDFFGIAMCSDLLFEHANLVTGADFLLQYDPEGGTVSGTIAGLPIHSEKVFLSSDFLSVYPIRFLRPPLQMEQHPIMNSMVLFGPNLSPRGRDYPNVMGGEFRLLPVRAHFQFRRPKIYELTFEDYYWFHVTGCYLTKKIDGVLGFLHFQSNTWYLTLRNGFSFLPQKLNGLMPNFGVYTQAIVVEIMPTAGGHFALIFLDYVPDRLVKGVNSAVYWRARLTPFMQKQDLARVRHGELSFKDYQYVPPFSVLEQCSLKQFAADGLIFYCPYGSYAAYWKPFSTCDLIVQREGDQLATYTRSYERLLVSDFNKQFSISGLYECVYEEAVPIFHILAKRDDKNDVGEPNLHPLSQVFDINNGEVEVFGACVTGIVLDFHVFLDTAGSRYRDIITKLVVAEMDREELIRLYYLVEAQVEFVTGRSALADKFIKIIQMYTAVDAVKIWNSLARMKLITPDPYHPDVRQAGQFYHAFIHFIGPKEGDPVVPAPSPKKKQAKPSKASVLTKKPNDFHERVLDLVKGYGTIFTVAEVERDYNALYGLKLASSSIVRYLLLVKGVRIVSSQQGVQGFVYDPTPAVVTVAVASPVNKFEYHVSGLKRHHKNM